MESKGLLGAAQTRHVMRLEGGFSPVSDLSYVERSLLEKLLGMSSGYVLNFSNRTFQEFIADSVGRDIYCGKYEYGSGSKANLLRKFWEVEPNHVVGKLVGDLIEFAKMSQDNPGLIERCSAFAQRLSQGAPIEDLGEIGEELTEKGFELLLKSIRTSIDNNEPQAGLDRLHTFVTKLLRRICDQNGIAVQKDKPLHSLLGEYIKVMKASGMIETEMTERILKSSIANLEAFNSVRNDHSFAHDNPVLNYDESLLIFSNVANCIRFIQALEQKKRVAASQERPLESDADVPF